MSTFLKKYSHSHNSMKLIFCAVYFFKIPFLIEKNENVHEEEKFSKITFIMSYCNCLPYFVHLNVLLSDICYMLTVIILANYFFTFMECCLSFLLFYVYIEGHFHNITS